MTPRDDKARIRQAGLKVTHPRLRILEVLRSSKRPLSVQDILERFERHVADQATVYRSAHALERAGVLRRIDLRHGHVAFELDEVDHHHHHVVCTVCGRGADISACLPEDMMKRVIKAAPGFAEINEHSLEFYGICRACHEKP